ncbi:unnamed protein product [Parnassius mnemosyne]|uniref:Pseudouridine-5'-phosphatase n=1 Tax=Parnassius mnemosyne TaxID=213953 RepID=A0AAV1LD74_9NEOP
MDGTILDSEVIYQKIVTKICERYGRTYNRQLQIQMYGVTDRELSVAVVRELKLPISVDEFEMQLSDSAKKLLPSAPLTEGAERLLTHLNKCNIPLALVTNSTEYAVRMHATERPELFALFHHKVSITNSEVNRGKPHPDIYVLAASKFPAKPRPSKCLVFEDSRIGVEAAVRAGMQVVMIPDHRLEKDFTRNATLVIRSLLHFRPELFGLPPFDDYPRKNLK